jgi:hypothetical protein
MPRCPGCPRYFFHVDCGEFIPDHEEARLPDLAAAKSPALEASGDAPGPDGDLWKKGSSWQMHITEEADRLLFFPKSPQARSLGDDRNALPRT